MRGFLGLLLHCVYNIVNIKEIGEGKMTKPKLPFKKLGEYDIQSFLGKGGMGEVYKGFQPSLQREVAIKTLGESFGDNPQFVRRFYREARAAASLLHPNVVQIYSIGHNDKEDVHFFAMEYVRGEDLSVLLAQEGRFVIERAICVIIQVLDALSAAAELGMVHRDIKPANIMISERGRVKVMDFGLAKITDDAELDVTEAGTVVGTANYMAPEQGMGKDIDVRTDLYSLGVVFYELITGRPPFEAEQFSAVIYKHVYEAPEPPSKYVDNVPKEIDAIILKLLSKNPDDRFLTPEECSTSLQPWASNTEISVYDSGRWAVVSNEVHSTVSEVLDKVELQPEEKKQQPRKKASDVCVLIADDIASARMLYSRVVQERGFMVIEAKDGLEAVALAVEYKPELIILDIGMPKLDGIGVIKELKRLDVSSKIIVITAHKDKETVLSIAKERIHSYIAKPVNLSNLRERLDSAIEFKFDDALANGKVDIRKVKGKTPDTTKHIILAIDDNEYTRRLYKNTFEHEYNVIGVASGKEAIALIEGDTPDMLILDMGLKDMIGVNILEHLESKNISVPSVVVSASTSRNLKTRLKMHGVKEVLDKPVSVPRLRAVVNGVLSNVAPNSHKPSSFGGLLEKETASQGTLGISAFAKDLIMRVPRHTKGICEKSINSAATPNAIAKSMVDILKRLPSDIIIDRLVNAYRTGDADVRALSAVLVRETIDASHSRSFLTKVASDRDYRVRVAALKEIAQTNFSHVDEFLSRFLGDEIQPVRNIAAELLEARSDGLCRPLIIYKALNDLPLTPKVESQVRELSDVKQIDELSALGKHSKVKVRVYIVRMLGVVRSQLVISELLKYTRDSHSSVRAEAIKKLATRDNPLVRTTLINMLCDATPKVQRTAIFVLDKMGLCKRSKGMMHILARRNKKMPSGIIELITMMEKNENLLDAMMVNLDEQSEDLRIAWGALLGELYGVNGIENIVDALNNANHTRRGEAIKSVLARIEESA